MTSNHVKCTLQMWVIVCYWTCLITPILKCSWLRKKEQLKKKNLNYNVKTDTNLIISVFLVFSYFLNLSTNNDFLSFFDEFLCEFFLFSCGFFSFLFLLLIFTYRCVFLHIIVYSKKMGHFVVYVRQTIQI